MDRTVYELRPKTGDGKISPFTRQVQEIRYLIV
jgi:hypothetical protein